MLSTPPLRSLTSPQPHGLAVLLELSNQLITLFHYVVILLVLVIWSVGFNDPLASHPVNGTWDPFSSDELGQVSEILVSMRCTGRKKNSFTGPGSPQIHQSH